jgi:hypothetical protein
MPTAYPAMTDRCPPNIGPRERRRRAIGGAISFAIGAALAVALIATDAPRFWRLFLLLPFWGGGLGVFQATFHT